MKLARCFLLPHWYRVLRIKEWNRGLYAADIAQLLERGPDSYDL
jgi:hypothetical protein